MKTFPKLRYPIHTKGLAQEERMILLAYDILWRSRDLVEMTERCRSLDPDYLEDLDANLANLGYYIEHNLCAMDMALRFEGYDKASPEDQETFEHPLEHDHMSRAEMEDEFQKVTLDELYKNKLD